MFFKIRKETNVNVIEGQEQYLELVMRALFKDNDYVFWFDRTPTFKNISPLDE